MAGCVTLISVLFSYLSVAYIEPKAEVCIIRGNVLRRRERRRKKKVKNW
jgi:hypothetical protein